MRVFGVVVGWSALFPGDRQTAMFPRSRVSGACCVSSRAFVCLQTARAWWQKITDIGNNLKCVSQIEGYSIMITTLTLVVKKRRAWK